eukprot:TRINITY_DN9305_c1_g2_i1.p1 TRINITY_DN9305_c1_g2~~TRINITY_DN9305_c1_g2_i1.p1  ORF type:complete len:196 (-),score=49.55 TRINITY_DN9305_c1_g2_i1:100-687(-)
MRATLPKNSTDAGRNEEGGMAPLPAEDAVTGAAQWRCRAAEMLDKAMARVMAGREPDSAALQDNAALAAAIADAFLAEHPLQEAKRRLLALLAALRSNSELGKDILAGGAAGAAALARQDTEGWASAKLLAQREAWRQEALREASFRGGQTSVCPVCGGVAILECGQSSDFKMAKQYAHYTCTEPACGKVTHIKQ